jgi:hypothetical protein
MAQKARFLTFDEDCHRIVAQKNRSRFSTACVVRMPLPERRERDATCQTRPFISTFLSFVPSLSCQMSVSHQGLIARPTSLCLLCQPAPQTASQKKRVLWRTGRHWVRVGERDRIDRCIR